MEFNDLIKFFNEIRIEVQNEISLEDSEEDYIDDRAGVEFDNLTILQKDVSYIIGKDVFTLKKLQYRKANNLDRYVLDFYVKYAWPQEGTNVRHTDMINDIVANTDEPEKGKAKIFLNELYTNVKSIFKEGWPAQVSANNLLTSSHWHDIVLFIQRCIKLGRIPDATDTTYTSLLYYIKPQWNELTENRPKKVLEKFNSNLQKFVKPYKMNLKIEDYKNLLKYKHQIILQGPPGTGKTHSAKDIAYSLIFNQLISTDAEKRKEQLKQLENSEQYNIIQFHPAYSYEDFVRGISAQSKNNQISYETKNRALGEFAEKAYVNYLDSQKDNEELSREKWIKEKLIDFTKYIEDTLSKDSKFNLKNNINILAIDDDAFRYKGETWGYDSRINFSEFLKLAISDVSKRKQIKNIPEISTHVLWRTTYYFALLEKFKEFISKTPFKASSDTNTVKRENYVMIIDEINRANLPSVLGELIYALEYRGEEVKSMYDLDGSSTLIIPPNLYIIGTMNTADRSVGHIDYAIRRRFAFVDVLPDESIITFPSGLEFFREIASIFKKHTANDFETNDIMLGHSYFLADNTIDLKLKLNYEVLPILKEYMKDGVFNKNSDSEAAITELIEKVDRLNG